MRRRDVALGTTSAALLAVCWSTSGWITAANAERGRRGKVVRVERPKAIATDEVQLCPLDTGGDQQDSPRLMCFGSAPRIGATIEFIDDQGYRGRGRVVSAEPGLSYFGRCAEQSGHTVYFDWTSRPPDQQAGGYGVNLVGVLGVKLNRSRSKLLTSPDRRPPEAESSPIAIGLDASGDGSSDLVVLGRECKANATSARAGGPGARQSATICFDYWLHSRTGWRLVNQAVIHSCF